ncbi:hypothetical protein DL96DRAFT_1557532 [Flagelloscypha sp. PMI_526]|nr:hypothetical protein DL96DRAFT_1557532 [Flagelloscypha sp. PMI_526]
MAALMPPRVHFREEVDILEFEWSSQVDEAGGWLTRKQAITANTPQTTTSSLANRNTRPWNPFYHPTQPTLYADMTQQITPIASGAFETQNVKLARGLTYHEGVLKDWDLIANSNIQKQFPARILSRPAVKHTPSKTTSVYIRIDAPEVNREYLLEITSPHGVRVKDVLRGLKKALKRSWRYPRWRGWWWRQNRIVDALHPRTIYAGFVLGTERNGRIVLDLQTEVARYSIFMLAILAMIDRTVKSNVISWVWYRKTGKDVYYEDMS